MRKVEIASEMRENKEGETHCTQPYLKSSIVCNAKRDKKTTSYRRGKASHALWWNLSNLLVLQKTALEGASAATNTFLSKGQAILSGGVNAGYNICDNLRDSSLEQNEDSSREWSVSANNRIGKFSLRQQPKAISKRRQLKNNSGDRTDTRLPEAEDVFFAKTDYQSFVGFRFNRFNNLWKADRRSKSRIQSTQERSAFLSSSALFRDQPEGILARDSATGERFFFYWGGQIPQGMFGKNTAACLPFAGAGGQWFLRSQIHRSIRRQRDWLCRSSQTDVKAKKRAGRLAVSSFSPGLVGNGIPISTLWLEMSPSIYRYSQKAASEGRGPDNIIYHRSIFVSGFCEQSSFGTGKYLAFLPRAGKHRKANPGIKGRLCFSQDSNQNFSSESNVFSTSSSGLQYYKLVQTNLSARKISEIYTTNDTIGDLSFTGQISQNRQPKFTEAAGRIHFSALSKTGYSEN